MTEEETRRMAKSGAIAGLCPITEANLGDGTFPAPQFLEEGGRYGIGSDSNILIAVPDELRQLEYSQRLALRARNVIAPTSGSTGRALYEQSVAGGGIALGAPTGLSQGRTADLVSLDVSAVPYLSGDQLLDQWLFASGVSVDSVWAFGRKQVSGGRHVKRDAIKGKFLAAMQRLVSA